MRRRVWPSRLLLSAVALGLQLTVARAIATGGPSHAPRAGSASSGRRLCPSSGCPWAQACGSAGKPHRSTSVGYRSMCETAVWQTSSSPLTPGACTIMGIRVSEEEEYEGVDIGECGLEAYPEFTSK